MTTVPTLDRFAVARTVADAVLYEGYLLYPYRASSTKNQVRWQFGVVVPPAFALVDPSERSRVRTEVVVDPGAAPVLTVRLRFLQVQRRTVAHGDGGPESWDEAREREIDLEPVPLLPLAAAARSVRFEVPGGEEVDGSGDRPVVRTCSPLHGRVDVDVAWADGPGALLRVAVAVVNEDVWEPESSARDGAIERSLVGLHVLLAVDDGELISSMDPPADAAPAVAGCANDGLYPVLIGEEGCADLVLASPIILYDHPTVAPESQGDMFDATEIDEILALRVLTLTDEEKAEARRTDERAAAIIDRCDTMPPELWARLHGAVRSLRPVAAVVEDPVPWWDPEVDQSFDPFTDSLVVDGVEVTVGTAVRLRPTRRADAHDMFLGGMDATVGGIFTDVDGSVMVGVTLDDDPATEALAWQGRYLFFHPDELAVRAP